jgi:hypothetical protein
MVKGVFAPQVKLNPLVKFFGLIVHGIVRLGMKIAM